MRSDWSRARLSDQCDLLTGFPFKSKGYVDDGVRLLRGDNVVQGALRWEGVKRWPADQIDDYGRYELAPGDVVLAMDRPWIEAGLKYAAISEHDLPALLVQRVARLRGRETLDTGFLRYLIGNKAFTDHVLAVQTGSAVPHISGSQILEFEFPLPPLEQQRAIALILGSLDDKIELNWRMNRTLEEMARTLFRSWFVDFDPVHANAAGSPTLPPDLAALFPSEFEPSPIGDVPKGWEVLPVGEAVECVGGGTPSTKRPEYWEGGGHHWATPKDLSALKSPVLLQTSRKLTDAGIAKISSGLLPPGTVLLSSRAPVGYLAITMIPVGVNQGFIALKPTDLLPPAYLLEWCAANMDTIKGQASGTTFAEISKKSFRPIQILVPSLTVTRAFAAAVEPMYKRITANVREADVLAAIRDAVLPRLLSGELDALSVPSASEDAT